MKTEQKHTDEELVAIYLKRAGGNPENWYEESCFLIQQNLKREFGITCTKEEADDFWSTYSEKMHYASFIRFYWFKSSDKVPGIDSGFGTMGEFVKDYFSNKS